jgi:hypothetical protein
MVVTITGVCLAGGAFAEEAAPLSEATETCLVCHAALNPGIVGDWKRGRHAKITPAEALKKEELARRVSVGEAPDGLANVVVGCAECHNLNPETHRDTFEHGGYRTHVVVTPKDCATCHPAEVSQYDQNLMSHAHGNLKNNLVYHGLVNDVNGVRSFDGVTTTLAHPDAETLSDSCYFCHGTAVEVKGMKERETALGEMEFPVLSGWPNQGVGRLNPDGSMGCCTACHTRHRFSIEMARKPHTCSECHKGPDVPAFKVYTVSKHGNIFSSMGDRWNFEGVPWVLGNDLTAPTCATCHISLVVNHDGEAVAERTHRMSDRLSWRLFGLVYAHAHPNLPDTTIIKNKAGLPLPTELTGEPAADFLIDAEEQGKRRKTMEGVCLACHGQGWVDGHFARLENTIETTNRMTLAATKILSTAWEKGAAKGLAQNDSIFNEAIEKKWVEQWLFFANSTRFASAMAGADYGVFANGRWYLSKNLQEMSEWLKAKLEKAQERKTE